MSAQTYTAADRAREPVGTTAGGQFAKRYMREPDVAMDHLSDDEYNADGSHEYPPYPRSAEQHISFWTSVPLPEDRLGILMERYDEIRDALEAGAGLRATREWEAANPFPDLAASSPERPAVEA